MIYEIIGYIFLIWGVTQLILLFLGWGAYFLKSDWIPTASRQLGLPYIGFIKPAKANFWTKLTLFISALFSLIIFGFIFYMKREGIV